MKKTTSSQKTIGPIILIATGGLIILILLISQLIGSPAPQTASDSGAAATRAEATVVALPRVPLAEAKLALDQKSAIFLDVRDPDSYSAGFIPGAINIPLNELEARSGELDPAKWIITYCT
jgi:hypothetical protein